MGEWLDRFIDRVMVALRCRRGEVESWPLAELAHWVVVDRRECIGPERREWLLASAAAFICRCQGAEVDVYDLLSVHPWNPVERPVMSDAAIAAAVGARWDEARGCYVG